MSVARRSELSHSKGLATASSARKDLLSSDYVRQPFEENQRQSEQHSQASRVWLYSLINTDYGGPDLLPHFLEHYNGVGIPYTRVFLDLLHDSALPQDGLDECRALSSASRTHTRVTLHEYTPDLQDRLMLSALSLLPLHSEDWIVVADMDELFTFGNFTHIHEVVRNMEAEGATYAMGAMLDHVALHGHLNRVSKQDIWQQFPLICPITSVIGNGLPAKVTLHKAFLRTGAGHHHVVEPYLASAYFKACTGLACEIVMKQYKQRSYQDMYELTPYSRYPEHYALSAVEDGWKAIQWSVRTHVHHFKWHAAVLESLSSRMTRDSGNCIIGVNENVCQPVFQFWKEVARTYLTLNNTNAIDTNAMICVAAAPRGSGLMVLH